MPHETFRRIDDSSLSGAYLARAMVVMIIVGSVLNLINHGEALFQGAPLNFAKLLLTYGHLEK